MATTGKAKETCNVANCIEEIYATKMCKYHYKQNWANKNASSIKKRTDNWRKLNQVRLTKNEHKYYLEHKESLDMAGKQWYQNNKDLIKSKSRKYYRSHLNEVRAYWRTPSYRYKRYQVVSKKKNRIFTLSLEEFTVLTAQRCFYCSEFSTEKENTGLDRVNNDIGYILTNVVPCCFDCNIMKAGLTIEEFKRKIQLIYNKLSNN